MSSLGLINCRIRLRFNTGVHRATGENQRTLICYDKFDRAARRACCVHLGHTHEYRTLLSRPSIRRQANLALFRGERDLLGQGRGLEGDALSCASRGAWCNLRVHSEVTRGVSYAVLLSRTSPFWGRLGEPGAECERGARPSPLHPS